MRLKRLRRKRRKSKHSNANQPKLTGNIVKIEGISEEEKFFIDPNRETQSGDNQDIGDTSQEFTKNDEELKEEDEEEFKDELKINVDIKDKYSDPQADGLIQNFGYIYTLLSYGKLFLAFVVYINQLDPLYYFLVTGWFMTIIKQSNKCYSTIDRLRPVVVY